MTSSLRNSLHRRNHKERSQLAHRSRLGILEKHKDYVKRARDFHSKQERIKRLKEKAAERNKNEFYFGMIRSKTEGGVHVQDRGNASLPTEMVKVLKSQDANYIRAVRQAGLKKIDKIKAQLTALADLVTPGKVGDDILEETDGADALNDEELHALRAAGILPSADGKRKRKSAGSRQRHIIFVSDEEEARNYRPPTASSLLELDPLSTHDDGTLLTDSSGDFSQRRPARQKPSNSMVHSSEQALAKEESKQSAAIHRQALLKELAARLKRDVNLRYAARELEMQKFMMGKGAARKIRGIEKVEGDNVDKDEDYLDSRKRKRRKVDVGMEEKQYKPRVYKWKPERKK